MTNPLQVMREQEFSELAYQFAQFIHRKESTKQVLVTFLAGLLTEAVQQGHVCLNLETVVLPANLSADFDVSSGDWGKTLLACNTVGRPGDYKPLILNERDQLYLYRYWLDERDVAEGIKQRLVMVSDVNSALLNEQLATWPSTVSGTDWQKVAVAVAVSRQLAVISGGPGTGKTTIVLKILQLIQQATLPTLRIALAAPTGKAAARLQQSISQQFQLEVKTLHRLLGITEQNEKGRFHAERKLPFDVVIIDEASMIDISLMAKLIRALPTTARLILLGDSQQLASVESGAVLANLSESQQGQFSSAFCEQFSSLGLTVGSESILQDSFVRLQHSYRFEKESLIGLLANMVNLGDVDSTLNLLQSQETECWLEATEQNLRHAVEIGYASFVDAIEQRLPAATVLDAFDSFRVLAALKQGGQSVNEVNRMMLKLLSKRGWRTQQQHFYGRPIMITQNDYRQHLFNGDIGVVLRDETSQLKACFKSNGSLRWINLKRLPIHETAFGMTVHKSQGSEFDAVCILLPDEVSPVLNKELLYTAVSRARKQLSLLAKQSTLKLTIQSQHQRESGLRHQLTL